MTNPTPLSIATHGPHKGYPTPKPCPFCGSTNLRYEFAASQGYICCDNCGTQGPCDERAADPICDDDAAYDAWNRRAALAEPEPQPVPVLPEGTQVIEPTERTLLVPIAKPMPVSERLPGPGDCTTNPRTGQGQWCWGWVQHDPSPYSGRWRMMRCEWLVNEAKAWLPAHALPLPGEGEA